MEICEESLVEFIDDKINLDIDLGKSLVDKLIADFGSVEGAQKTRRNIEKEIKFLQKLQKSSLNCEVDQVDVVRKLNCTNLNFFSHLVNSLYNYEGITSISASRKFEDGTIKIDIIANDNQTWVKIIARNSESIKDEVLGRCEFGSKNILEVAAEFIKVANSQHIFFQPPNVVFDFLNPIDEELESALEKVGIILGRKFRLGHQTQTKVSSKLNVDITTMLAYISELSNGGANYHFAEKLIEMQAVLERRQKIKPELEEAFKGKELICCETAVKSFDEIVNLLAGPKEKKRAEEFKSRITILPDVDHPEKIINLPLSSQIKERSRRIFAFGIHHKAVTISSNVGFTRAANMRHFDVPVILHAARALTELKTNLS